MEQFGLQGFSGRRITNNNFYVARIDRFFGFSTIEDFTYRYMILNFFFKIQIVLETDSVNVVQNLSDRWVME